MSRRPTLARRVLRSMWRALRLALLAFGAAMGPGVPPPPPPPPLTEQVPEAGDGQMNEDR